MIPIIIRYWSRREALLAGTLVLAFVTTVSVFLHQSSLASTGESRHTSLTVLQRRTLYSKPSHGKFAPHNASLGEFAPHNASHGEFAPHNASHGEFAPHNASHGEFSAHNASGTHNSTKHTSATRRSVFSNAPQHQNVKHSTRMSDHSAHIMSNVDRCRIGNIRSWKRGIITQLKPELSRDCGKLINQDPVEINRVQYTLRIWHKQPETRTQFHHWSPSCSNIMAEFQNSFYVSQEEKQFPLAFTFVIYSRPVQVIRLLKAIYRPHNVYCIHPDAKAQQGFINIFRHLAFCLENVIIPEILGEVYYAHHTIMDAQMKCMAELLKRQKMFPWKYAINVCGTELPLRTNREIVRALKPLYSQHISALDMRSMDSQAFSRFRYKHVLNKTSGKNEATNVSLGPPPHNILLQKSWNFIAATQEFVEYILYSKVANDFCEWIKDAYIPEEHFYASLYFHNHPHTPGGYSSYYVQSTIPSVAIYQWMNTHEVRKDPHKYCSGFTVHSICIQTSADLHHIYELGLNSSRTYFFFNKYFMEMDHIVMDCMEERLVERNKREYQEDCGQRQTFGHH